MRRRAVIFDLDDTLYPERQYVLSGFRAVASWAGVRLRLPRHDVFRELKALFDRGVRGTTFDRWLQHRHLDPDRWRDEMVSVYRGHRPRIVSYRDVRPVLAGLHGRFKVGLVTDGYQGTQRRKLRSLQLDGFFDAVVVSDELGPDAWKPSPVPFLAALADLGIDGPGAVYVGDNPFKDFIGARSLGIRTVRLRRRHGQHQRAEPPTPAHAADLEITGLRQLAWALRSLAADPAVPVLHRQEPTAHASLAAVAPGPAGGDGVRGDRPFPGARRAPLPR